VAGAPVDHLKVVWHHDSPEDPVLLYSELDGERREVRKVEVYADGCMDRADANSQTGTTWLSVEPIIPLDEICAQPQFAPESISAIEFEAVWNAAEQRAGPS
jgi:hypothetical protein